MLALIIGGSASGKSEYAERHVLTLDGTRIYLATMETFGEEAAKRIRKHRAQRSGKGFQTIECCTGLDRLVLPPDANVLLEDLGNLVANELFSAEGGGPEAVQTGLECLLANCRHLTVVTNDVFSGGKQYDEGTISYMKKLAEANRLLAKRADFAAEIVCGIPNILKGREEKR